MELIKHKLPIYFAIIPPSIFLLSVLITHEPDGITFIPILGIAFWLVQMVCFIFAGWVGAIIGTMFLLSVIGYLAGLLVKKISIHK